MDVHHGYLLWRWLTFACWHKHEWAQVGVRFHVRRVFVINMAASSPLPSLNLHTSSLFLIHGWFRLWGSHLACVYWGAAAFVQSGASWVGWSWWPTTTRTSQLVHSRDPKKPVRLPAEKQRCMRTRDRTVGPVSPYRERTKQPEENGLAKDV